ncbi:hypothetical protein ACFV9D_16990 [Streptomyces sp. NPDC059875]|uniref:hypothetical protein n=1 Tax=unclassified Streptomyces TaxID=2593676 RepID=UPI00365BA8F5
MRLRNALALGVTAATTGAAVLALAVAPSSADPAPSPGSAAGSAAGSGADPGAGPRSGADPGSGTDAGTERLDKPPTCGKATDPDFPLDTRIHGGPGSFVPGSGFQAFKVDLTNTTAEPCHSIHPVLALADRDRVLRPAQIRLDFYDSEARLWRPVRFEETEEDENIGVFTGFPGFAVPAGRTVTVGVRLAFRADTAPNEVVANAAIVQRQGDDGDWVGESDDYRLTIAPEGDDATDGGTDPAPVPSTGDNGLPPVSARPEIADTGGKSVVAPAAVTAGLLLAGAVFVTATRRTLRRK